MQQKIGELALEFDRALEKRDIDAALALLHADCEIVLLGQTLYGKPGARKWLEWLYASLAEIRILPKNTFSGDSLLFSEYTLKARLYDGSEVESEQAEVLEFEGRKIKSLRLYFDRFDFVDAIATDMVSKTVARTVIEKSLKGLV